MISLAMTFVILTGGHRSQRGQHPGALHLAHRDAVDAPWTALGYGTHIALAIAAAVAASTLAGALNGIAIATLRVQPFIVTLAIYDRTARPGEMAYQ